MDTATRAIDSCNNENKEVSSIVNSIDSFIQIKYDIGTNLIDIIDKHSNIINIEGLEAPIITKMSQEDLTTVKVNWKSTEKTIQSIKKCKDIDNFEFELLPMLDGGDGNKSNNANLIVLKSIMVNYNNNNNNNYEYLVKLPENWDTDHKMDEFESKEQSLFFQCQIRIVNKILNCQSLWSNLSKEPFYPKYDCVFSNLNGTGRTGPTSLGTYYKDKCHEKHVKLENGIQIWNVPCSGFYKIVCYGASGGDNSNSNKTGGKGAKVGGLIKLNKNDEIKILVGQQGTFQNTNRSNCSGAGGGGGTFVVGLVDTKLKPIMIAAGGNGACYYNFKVNGIDGMAVQSENRNDSNQFGGVESNGRAARGGSLKDDFNNLKTRASYEKCNPQSFVQGGLGGCQYSGTCGSDGGFGGGGGSRHEGGGGGGYIGGLPAKCNQYSADFSTYGALSFNAATKERIMESGVNVGHGKVKIQLI